MGSVCLPFWDHIHLSQCLQICLKSKGSRYFWLRRCWIKYGCFSSKLYSFSEEFEPLTSGILSMNKVITASLWCQIALSGMCNWREAVQYKLFYSCQSYDEEITEEKIKYLCSKLQVLRFSGSYISCMIVANIYRMTETHIGRSKSITMTMSWDGHPEIALKTFSRLGRFSNIPYLLTELAYALNLTQKLESFLSTNKLYWEYVCPWDLPRRMNICDHPYAVHVWLKASVYFYDI